MKIIPLALSLAIVILLIGCTGGEPQKNDSQNTQNYSQGEQDRGNSSWVDTSACRNAVARCNTDRAVNGDLAKCTYCDEACIDPVSRQEVAPNAIANCKQGKNF